MLQGTFLLEILQLVAFLPVVLSGISPVCQSSADRSFGPALPSLPSVFMTKLEGSFLNKNMSFSGEEYFDNTTDQVAILYASQRYRSYSIMNYRIDEGIRIDLNSGNCSVFKLSNSSRGSIMSPRYDKQGREHVASIADFFQFGKKFNESFKGETIVRGTRVLHWQSCVNHGNFSYTVDWYFSVPYWKTTSGKSPVPVRCVVNGTGYSYRLHRTHSFYHVYDFSDFQGGVHPPPQKFQPPFGTYCKDEMRQKPLPKLPRWFSNGVEMVSRRYAHSSTSMHYYDMDRKLVRFDHSPWRGTSKSLFVVEIHDFNTGVSYSIDDITSECTMTPLNISWYGKHDERDHDIHMKSPFELFWHDNDTIRYEGVAVIRGVETNVWVSRTQIKWRGKNHTVVREWYFSQPHWRMNAGHKVNQTEIPMLFRSWFNGTNIWSINLFNFDAENPNLRIFDVGKCFSWSKTDRRLGVIGFNGDYGKLVKNNVDVFLNVVMDAISRQVGITLLRMSDVSVFGFSDRIWLQVAILQRPAMEGKTVHMAMKEPDLNDAFAKLETIVNSGNLKVKMPGHSAISAVSFNEDEFGDPPKRSKKKGSKSTVVGIGIATLLLGLFIGVFICYVVLKRRGVSLFSYQRHTDEL